MKKGIIIILIIIFNFILIAPGISYIVVSANVDAYSTCDDDLKGFGIDESTLVNEDGVNHQVNVLLFAETTNENGDYYYYLYVHDPNAFAEIETKYYQSVQIGYLTAFTEEVLDDSEAITRSLRYLNLIYLSSSSSGTVAKYLLNDFNPDDIKTFRRYQIRQLMTQKNGERTFINIGDEYFYKTNDDGTAEYQYKKMDYITTENPVAASISLENTTFLESVFDFIGNEDNQTCYFYGFSIPKEYKVEQLLEVDIFYKYMYWDYWSGSLVGDVFYDTEWLESSPYWPYWSEEKSNTVTINEEHVSFKGREQTIFFSESYTLDWKTIATPEKLIDGTNHEGFKNFVETNFSESEYIINFLNEEFTFTKNTIDGSLIDSDWTRNFKNWCIKKYNTTTGYRIKTNKITSVEMVRMKFNSQGEIYDLAVIINPVTPSNPDDMDPNPNWWDYLVELYNKFVKWIMETFKVSEIVAHIIAVGSIIGGISLIMSLLTHFLGEGLSKIIKNIVNIIISILTWPARLLFSDNKDLIMKKGE